MRRHESEGWVLKDPLTLEYVVLNDLEFNIFNQLDGRVTASRLLQHVTRLGEGISIEELSGFLRHLAARQLLRSTVSASAAPPSFTKTASTTKTASATTAALVSAVVKPVLQLLRLRIPLLNPTRLLDAVMPVVQPLFQPAAVAVMISVTAIAAVLVVLRFDEITDSFPHIGTLLGPANLPLMLLVFVIVKVLHEAGHAFTCRHFGAECHEAGIMLLVMTPVLYTNVTDAWLLPRRQRLLVTAAGLVVELVLASVCTILWFFAAPGLTRTVLLNTMIVCSVNTVLFNGNPLLRFDGYFLLSDWMNLPNLGQRASATVQAFFQRLLTAGEMGSDEPADDRHGFLLSYGVLSLLYRTVLTIAILKLLQTVGREWNLRVVTAGISVAVLFAFIVTPVAAFSGALIGHHRTRGFRSSAKRRILLALPVLIALAAIPLPHSVIAPAIVLPDAVPVYASLPGQVFAAANYGDTVQAGDVLAEFRNPDLQQRQQQLQAELKESRLRLEAILRDPQTAGSPLVPALRESMLAVQGTLDNVNSEYAALSIRSSISGTLLPPRVTPTHDDDDLPEHWSGLPLEHLNRQSWINRGTLLGYVGEPETSSHVAAFVSEYQLDTVRPGQSLQFLSVGTGAGAQRGIVERVAPRAADELPSEIVAARLAAAIPNGAKFRPAEVVYEVTIRIVSEEAGATQLFGTGRVRIQTDSVSLWRRLQGWLQRTFSR
ncbi:MAG: M50 family metallopeptidase [Planctomycetaceae bacterium]